MKKIWKLSILCAACIMLSACGEEGGAEEDDGIQVVESEPLDAVISEDVRIPGTEEPESGPSDGGMAETEKPDGSIKKDSEADPYAGVYDSYDTEEPDLKIRKNADGRIDLYKKYIR